MENLGVRPGAVTPLSMINGVKSNVQIFMDADLQSCVQIYVHPLVNDRTLGMSIDGINSFLDKIGVTVTWVDFTSTDD